MDEIAEFKYEVAEGPQGLREVLDRFFDRAKQDQSFAAERHYILYQLGEQKSLINVDMSKEPFQFWYNDLLGRPATSLAKNAIMLFLQERCGVLDPYEMEAQGTKFLYDFHTLKLNEKVEASKQFEVRDLAEQHNIVYRHTQLEEAIANNSRQKLDKTVKSPSYYAAALTLFGESRKRKREAEKEKIQVPTLDKPSRS